MTGYAPPGGIGDGQYGDRDEPEPDPVEPSGGQVVEPAPRADSPAEPVAPSERPPAEPMISTDSLAVTTTLPAVPLYPDGLEAPVEPDEQDEPDERDRPAEPEPPPARPAASVWLGATLVLALLLVAVLLAWSPWA